jgi:hypothetical protein
MYLNKKTAIGKALFIVALSYLLYNSYQAIVTTIFISNFPSIVTQIPHMIESSQPTLQLTLFVLQELLSSIGVYLRLIGGVFALYAVILILRKDKSCLFKLGQVMIFESLYFAFLFFAGVNHIVGSIISFSELLNVYTGLSFLLQAVLIFPPLFILSRKLGGLQDISTILNWAFITAALYVFGLWIKHGLMWVYALSPMGTQQASVLGVVGFVNSWLTLLTAFAACIVLCRKFRRNKKLNFCLMGTVMVLIGFYFITYAVVSVWVPIYLAFLPLIEFWLIVLPILGAALLLRTEPR